MTLQDVHPASFAGGGGLLSVYLNQIAVTPLLSAEEEKQLGAKIVSFGCRESRDRLIRANLRLVVAIAKRFSNSGLPLDELIAEGNVGLIRAAAGFDPSRGAKFSTYATWPIKQGILRALFCARSPVNVPHYMHELIVTWRCGFSALSKRLGRPPTRLELADELNLPVKQIRVIEAGVRAHRATAATLQRGCDDSPDLGEVLRDEGTGVVGDMALQSDELDRMLKFIDLLDLREATMLRLRFGLGNHKPLTLRQIADAVGLSRERVRQITDKSLEYLSKCMSEQPRSVRQNASASRHPRGTASRSHRPLRGANETVTAPAR